MQKLRVLSLFSGIGGLELGLEWTGGFVTVAQCEKKPHARAVLAKNWPGVHCHDDVTTYEFKEGEADVITAGFPCQDLSYAGVGAGLSGARSGLYREVIRGIRVVRPLRAVLENVAALLSRGLGTVLGDLAEIGYDAEWHCIPASAVGAPHRRDRIWIVANPCDFRHGADNGFGKDTGETVETRSAWHQRKRVRDVSWGSRAPLSGWLAKSIYEIRADAAGQRCSEAREFRYRESEERSARIREEVADAGGVGCEGQRFSRKGEPASEQKQPRREVAGGSEQTRPNASWWATEPGLGRVADGVPNRVDRLEELGNAVVPQIPEVIGRAILASLAQEEAA